MTTFPAVVFGSLAIAFGAAFAVSADTRATVLLKSGERVTGEFEDIHNGEIYVRVSQDQERRVPVTEALVIDFDGNARDLSREEAMLAKERGDVLVFRNGSIWQGDLDTVYREGEGGGETIADAVIEVVFRHDDGTERVRIGEVARLYLGDTDLTNMQGVVAAAATVPQNPAATAPSGTPSGAFTTGQPGRVPANVRWTPTPFVVSQGERLTFSASGEVTLGPNEVATVDGLKTRRVDPGAPLPDQLAGALIGRVGTGQPFGIGSQTQPLPMPNDGQLYLGVNESASELSNNSGHFNVTITK